MNNYILYADCRWSYDKKYYQYRYLVGTGDGDYRYISSNPFELGDVKNNTILYKNKLSHVKCVKYVDISGKYNAVVKSENLEDIEHYLSKLVLLWELES